MRHWQFSTRMRIRITTLLPHESGKYMKYRAVNKMLIYFAHPVNYCGQKMLGKIKINKNVMWPIRDCQLTKKCTKKWCINEQSYHSKFHVKTIVFNLSETCCILRLSKQKSNKNQYPVCFRAYNSQFRVYLLGQSLVKNIIIKAAHPVNYFAWFFGKNNYNCP